MMLSIADLVYPVGYGREQYVLPTRSGGIVFYQPLLFPKSLRTKLLLTRVHFPALDAYLFGKVSMNPMFEVWRGRSTRVVQKTTLTMRMMSSSGEKIVSRRGTRGAAVAAASRVISSRPNGTALISLMTA